MLAPPMNETFISAAPLVSPNEDKEPYSKEQHKKNNKKYINGRYHRSSKLGPAKAGAMTPMTRMSRFNGEAHDLALSSLAARSKRESTGSLVPLTVGRRKQQPCHLFLIPSSEINLSSWAS